MIMDLRIRMKLKLRQMRQILTIFFQFRTINMFKMT